MDRKSLDREWKFADGAGSIYNLLMPNENIVNLPHDFTIKTDVTPSAPGGKESGFYTGGVGNYTKKIFIPEEWSEKRILLEFDGAYMNTEVNINGHLAEVHPYGYAPFHADLTNYVNFGKENRINVIVNNSAPESGRWYTGSGIYRHVDLLTASKIHLSPWSIFAHTDRVENGNAYVITEVTVENHTNAQISEQVTVTFKPKNGTEKVTGFVYVTVPAMSKQTGKVSIVIPNAKIWDIDSPEMYDIKAVLGKEAEIDTDQTEFGIRMITLDREHGLRLNGRVIKLKGGCVHHDNGLLGAASFYDSEFRRMKLHKDNGYNAIRSAHNPPSRDMLKACDQLGLLVLNEAFDVWKMQKNPNDYHLYFDQWWKKDMELFMTRDRNHPCIFAWSTGNEIVERHGLGEGYRLAQELADYARNIDPTRFITNSIPIPFNGLNDDDMQEVFKGWMELSKQDTVQNLGTRYSNAILPERTEQYIAPLDFVGYNYMEYRYEEDAEKYPHRIICGTESYPQYFDRFWEKVEKLPYVIGDFTWTSYDYIGEAGGGQTIYSDEKLQTNPMQGPAIEYPWRLARQSDFDLCGFDRIQLHFRKIIWGSDETYIAVHPPKNMNKYEYRSRWGWPESYNAWTFDGYEGKQTLVDVYSSAEEVELIINGKSQGKKTAGKNNHYKAQFSIEYQPGTIEALSFSNDVVVSRQQLKTVGKEHGVKITLEKEQLSADGQNLCYALVEIVDENGNRVPFAEHKVHAVVTGVGTLAGFGTGNPITEENYTTGEFTSFEGRLQAIVRSGYEVGEIELKVTAQGIGEATKLISVVS